MPRPAETVGRTAGGLWSFHHGRAHPPGSPVDTGRVRERTWATTWRYVFGMGVCLLLAYFPFVRHTRVPLLGLVDLGFHELGHLVTHMLPAVIMAAMGSVT